MELADPGFASVGELIALLRDVEWVLLNPFENVEDEEIAFAVARATGRQRRSPRIFAASTAEWGYHLGPPGGGPVEMLEAIQKLPQMRRQILDLAKVAAQHSMMKEQAAVISKPGVPIEIAVAHHLREMRMRTPNYGDNLSAAEVLERAGGISALPWHEAHERLMIERLRLKEQKSTSNDVLDEYITAYAPYVPVTAVDRRTYHRVQSTRLSFASRVTRSLREVPTLIARVQAGELQVSPSA